MLERLDKLLANQLGMSRKDAKGLLKAGLVTVDGATVKSGETKVDVEKALVAVEGKPVRYQKNLYLMLNKPAGVLSSTKDGRTQTVIDLLPEGYCRPGLFPAGRLDKDTEGFVLLTDDGALAHSILSPRRHVAKTYIARLDGQIDASVIGQFEAGMAIDGGDICLPAKLRPLDEEPEQLVEVVITQGMFHQIKRMFQAVGRQVLTLKRVKMGGLALDETLPLGACRELTTEELKKLTEK